MRLKKSIFLFVFVGTLMQGAPADKPPVADLLIQKAHSLEARDRADLAAQVWQQVLITNPNQPDALLGLARWAKRSGNLEEANAYLAKLRKVSRDTASLAQLDSVDTSKTQKARLDEAAKLTAAQRYDEAMRIYRDTFGPNPPAGGWAIAYYETLSHVQGGFEPAIAALKKLAADYPDVLDYQVAVGRILTYRPGTRLAGVSLLSGIGGSTAAAAKAQAAWRQALLWEKSNRAYSSSLRAYLNRYPDTELKTALDTLNATPVSSGVEVAINKDEQQGYEALKQSDIQQAEEHFSAALATDEQNGRARAGLGFIRMKQGDFAGAIEQFQQAQRVSPKNENFTEALETAKFWNAMQIATKLAGEGNWDAAVKSYETALVIKKSSPEALQGLGGALLGAGRTAQALPYFTRLTQLHPNDPESWRALAGAKLQAEGGKSVLKMVHSLSPSVSAKLVDQPEWQILLASAYYDAGQQGEASKLYGDLQNRNIAGLPAEAQIQLASLQLHFHHEAQAVESMQHLLATHSENTGAWEILISALTTQGKYEEADNAYRRMPENVRQIALEHPGFLQSAAALAAKKGDLDGAIAGLQKILQMPVSVADEKTKLNTRVQLAPLFAQNGQLQNAQSLMEGILEAQPQNDMAWRTYLSLLQDSHQTSEVVATASRMPQSVALRLGTDGDVVSLLASAHAANGNPDFAVRLLQTYLSRPKAGETRPSARLQLQLAWLLLNTADGQRNLYRLLEQLHSRTDLTAQEHGQVLDIWSTWILRTAERAKTQGSLPHALAVLEQGASAFPENANLQRAFAGYLLQAGDSKRALNVYANWGLTDAVASDYAGAIGASLSQRNYKFADDWLQKGLSKWPSDSKLLAIAGERAKAKGDLKKAERYWREALMQKQSEPVELSQTEKPVSGSTSTLKSLLLGSAANDTEEPASSANRAATRLVSETDTFYPAQRKLDVHLSSARSGESANDLSPVSKGYTEPVDVNRVSTNLIAKSGDSPVSADLRQISGDSIEDKLASLQSRSTPFLESRTSVQSRSGQAGYDRLLIEQANFEASTVIANQFRVTVLAKPTYLDGGRANGQDTRMFGTSPAGTMLDRQSAGGLAAETQISSQVLGLRVGTSPQGFLAKNIVAGVRFQPGNGAVTFLLERDSVKDTMLSYAGVRDSLSNQIWGGVVANSASVLGHWGDDNSGVYASAGYQLLTGKGVASNRALNGNFGTYWKVMSVKEGGVTVGMNFSGMHYDKNLRYFTLGQGGYFSPQQYYLFNVPFHWSGTYNRKLQYIVGASVGLQHFQENASVFFPTNAVLQLKNGGTYSSMTSTGANFSFEARINYQLAPHWLVGTFVNANNSRNYVSSAVGLFVNYTFQARPLSLDNSVTTVPDWRGQQPFTLF